MQFLSLVAQTLLITAAIANPVLLDKRAPAVSKTTTTSCSYVSATPSPAPLICGREGSIKDLGNSFLTWNAGSSTNVCLNFCKDDPECISYSFQSAASTCMYYNASIKSNNFQDGDTGNYFWNHRCFVNKCTAKTLTVTSTSSKSTTIRESTHTTDTSTSKTSAKASPTMTSDTTSTTSTTSTKASPTKTSDKTLTTLTTSIKASTIKTTDTISVTVTIHTTALPTTKSDTTLTILTKTTILKHTKTSSTTTTTPATCTAPPTSPSTCPTFSVSIADTVDVLDYTIYFDGTGVTENTANPGNTGLITLAPETFTFPGDLSLCAAAEKCAGQGTLLGLLKLFYSFDLHFVETACEWECVLYSGANTNATYFDVANSTIGAVAGYSGALVVSIGL